MTTISPFALQRFLSQLVGAGCQYAILEVTSHAIAQERIYGILFDTVVFTNLTHDHLDYHQSFEDYRETKLKLFAHHPHVAVVNADDKNAEHFLKFPADLRLTYSINGRADIRAVNIQPASLETTLRLLSPGGTEATLTLPLPGQFNVYNALAATAAAIGNGVRLATITDSLTHFTGVPGRMEKIGTRQPFSVLIDYAHTPDAFQQIYSTIRPSATGKIIHVFGATGDRDKTKRPILGAIAAKYADYIIVTNEDPYTEDAQAIMEAVAEGVLRAGKTLSDRKEESKQFWKILDRRQAIAQAFSLAKKGDIVLLTGKGAEQAMVVGGKKIPWDDRKVAREELAKLGYK